MLWVLYIGGGLVALFALFVLWGFLHRRQSMRQALAEILRIELADIEPLARECVEVFHRKLGVRLDLNDCEDTAQKLDDAFRDVHKLKGTFARDDFYWYFVEPVGACLGELLRRHAKHQWHKQAGESPCMEVQFKNGGHSQVFPFDKAIKQALWSEPGDLFAYVVSALTIERVADQLAQE